MSKPTTPRERWDALCDHFGVAQHTQPVQYDGEQFATVARLDARDEFVDTAVRNCATFDDACLLLEDEVLSGWVPEGIWDLHTGERIALHVSVKVTRSEDQHAVANPLDEL